MNARRLALAAVSLVALPLALTACGGAQASGPVSGSQPAAVNSPEAPAPSDDRTAGVAANKVTAAQPKPAGESRPDAGRKAAGPDPAPAPGRRAKLNPIQEPDLRRVSREGSWQPLQPVDNPDRGDYTCQRRSVFDFSPVRTRQMAMENLSVGMVQQDLASFRTKSAARAVARALVSDISACSPRPKGVKIHRDAVLGQSHAWTVITPDEDEGIFDYIGVGVRDRVVTVVVLTHSGQDSNYDPAPSTTLLKAALRRL